MGHLNQHPKKKIVNENHNLKKWNVIKVFDKDNKLINDVIVNLGNLVSIKCYVRYWRHFVSKWHGITLESVDIKKFDQGRIIVDSYNTHIFII